MAPRTAANAAKRKIKADEAGGKRPCRKPPEPAEVESDDCQVDVCHVNIARHCTAGTQQPYCWLREELSHWNAILNRINLQVREFEPGKLSINSMPLQWFPFSTAPIIEDAAMLLVWLLKRHRCVERVSVSNDLPTRLLAKAMRHCSNLRHMSLKGAAGGNEEQSLAKAFDALLSVESLSLSSFSLCHSSLRAVGSLIVRSARTLTKLELQGQLFPPGGDEAVMDAVLQTEMLGELVLSEYSLTRTSLEKIALLLSSTQTLTKLTLDVVAPAIHCSWYGVARALRRNTSLVQLRIGAHRLTPVLEALEENSTMKCLQITSKLIKEEIEALAKGLEKNTGLTTLKFSKSRVKRALVRELAKVLHVNSTLERLEMTSSHGIDLREVKDLYAALSKNNTLKRLAFSKLYRIGDDSPEVSLQAAPGNWTCDHMTVFPVRAEAGISQQAVRGWKIECAQCSAVDLPCLVMTMMVHKYILVRPEQTFALERLASMLLESGCSHRVATDWYTGEFPFLTMALKEVHNGPVELHLHDDIDIDTLGPELFSALSQSTALRKLSVTSCDRYSLIWSMLASALDSSGCIKSLHVNLNRHKEPSIPIGVLVKALATNTSVSSVSFDVAQVDSKVLSPLAQLLALNRTLTTLALTSLLAVISAVLDPLALAIEENHVILAILIGPAPLHDSASIRICEVVRRNTHLLACAVQFVMGSYVTRRSAEAYERLRHSGSLLLEVERAAKGTEKEPGNLLAAAEYNLRCNYLILANVIRRAVECCPAPHTQIDALNDACWYHIAKYLKIRDVLKPN